jgi:hypothetical protein
LLNLSNLLPAIADGSVLRLGVQLLVRLLAPGKEARGFFSSSRQFSGTFAIGSGHCSRSDQHAGEADAAKAYPEQSGP